jgi:hypothetical protein
LINRGGGMIYDTTANITWLADMNYAYTSGYVASGVAPGSAGREHDLDGWPHELGGGKTGRTTWSMAASVTGVCRPLTLDTTCSLNAGTVLVLAAVSGLQLHGR